MGRGRCEQVQSGGVSVSPRKERAATTVRLRGKPKRRDSSCRGEDDHFKEPSESPGRSIHISGRGHH
jgi:hypothetical protein